MKPIKKYSLAYSSCPNDTFIFKAIARQLIPLDNFQFDIAMEDVETLNQKAAAGIYDITKLSFASFGSLMDRYALLRAGSALGMGCGPLIISTPGKSLSDKKNPVVAVPGMGTTACYLFKFYINDLFPGMNPKIIAMPFEKVMLSVVEKTADFGVIIHEGRFVYPSFGLELQADLGQWWEKTTSLPIPLGCIAIRRELGPETACNIQRLIRQSIEHAFIHPETAYDYIQTHAQELEEDVIRQHIELYVNDFSKDFGEKGEKAIITFFDKAKASGLIRSEMWSETGSDKKYSPEKLFAC
ncbi:MAG: 1,4-dihydroxy-6-naphthoate synthase [Proteobacteria bacterium]|nr:1,4-dihydroxy-6-naphthoate synthase [Pseudomonadota bacterium]MBU1389992.1 1,4-dihydroxy-6-naphthoate synthase [Pseudomonadota bacterium]MBU1545057.1 1,4-dihydroxy-6-naphthoate synthase [Pseudomonadota bacterium]MBU2480436.1 1,4-dihydroxy-6-naphthoate synthase [Pseudomonadota bacterium]